MMKALVTKIKTNSVSDWVARELRAVGIETYALPDGKDIRLANHWLAQEITPNTNILINTVGVTDSFPVGEGDIKSLDRIVSVNLVGAMVLTEAFIKLTKNMKTPRLIIHVGSVGARKVFTGGSAYCASKAGLAHYITCAGYELRDSKISIIGVHPDNIKGTPMTKRVQNNLIKNRGMSWEQVNEIYKRAIPVENVGAYISSIVEDVNNWKFLNGENIYLGAGCKRGY